MKDIKSFESDLASIKSAMERSVKFMSLSGLSGILAGIYALAGATYAYFILYHPNLPFGHSSNFADEPSTLSGLIGAAATVLVLSLFTGYWLSRRKAKKTGEDIWNRSSKDLLMDVSVPLIAGGLFMITMIQWGYFGMIAPACLIFYGLALVQGSARTFGELRYLGLFEISIGLATAVFPGYGLISLALGFGALHIIYGTAMYIKYEK